MNMLHSKGWKGDRDRSRLIHSYNEMVKEFHIPKSKSITAVDFSKMTNKHIYQACSDLYNGAPLKDAQRLKKKIDDANDKAVALEMARRKRMRKDKTGFFARLIKAVFHG